MIVELYGGLEKIVCKPFWDLFLRSVLGRAVQVPSVALLCSASNPGLIIGRVRLPLAAKGVGMDPLV